MLIRGKGKIGCLDGSVPQPSKDDSSLGNCEMNTSLFMSRLIHSMESHIGAIDLFYPTAKVVRDVVSLAYSDLEDSSQMFTLRNRACNVR